MMAVGLFTFSCKNEQKEVKEEMPVESYKLTKLWESDTVFTTVEAVIFDPKTDLIYVSNIEGEPWGADGVGSIGKLKMDGTVVEAKWITGLSAPKGLGIIGDKLYVTDIKNLVEIDIPTGKISKTYTVEDSEGLNDVSTSADGIVYFTDSQKGVLHMLKDGVVSVVVDSLQGSNGVFVENDRLLLGTWGDESLTQYKFADKSISIVADSITQPDGVEAIGDGGYLVSSWKGLIHHVSADGTTSLLLDTAKDTISAADIDFVQDKKTLLIPTFFRNTVAAYSLAK